jgi:hypothetical protein
MGTTSDASPSVPPGSGISCNGASPPARVFTSTNDLAVALHGLWVPCSDVAAPALCAPGEEAMYFGSIGGQDPTSRVASCGHLSSHGSSFLESPAYKLTYEVTEADEGYVLHMWNAQVDATFHLTYGGDAQTLSAAIQLVSSSNVSGTLRSSAFTVY